MKLKERIEHLNEFNEIRDKALSFFSQIFNVNVDREIPQDIQRNLERRIEIDAQRQRAINLNNVIDDETKELFAYRSALRDFNPNMEHMRIMIQEAKRRRIDPTLVLALVTLESSFRENAINRNRNGTHDYGYFQLNNRWHNQHRGDVRRHIITGIEHLQWCLRTENNNVTRALSRYNTGRPDLPVGQAYARRILSIQRDIDSTHRRAIANLRNLQSIT